MNYKSLLLVASMFVWSASSAGPSELTRESCRKLELNQVDEIADCEEKKIYEACEDAGGPSGDARCVVGKVRLAERRIDRATKAIALRSAVAGVEKRESVNAQGERQPVRDHAAEGSKIWREYVWEQCLLLNELYDVGSKSGERLGTCQIRLMEQRATLLEKTLAGIPKGK